MNIKSLLLGSAAAMVAVSGAQAADAVVVEPEPVEYVRVCDAYGSGFFYIPGTETCIRFSGFIRSSYEKTSVDITGGDTAAVTASAGPDGLDGTADDVAAAAQAPATPVSTEQNFVFWGNRARLNVDTRNETDWGTLRGLFRLEGGDSNSDADIDMDIALISLAGFRAGFTGANYWTRAFAGVNLTGLGSSGFTGAEDDGWYGFNDGVIFDYTWAADGFSVTVGVEDPRIDWSGIGSGPSNAGTSDSRANFYAGFDYSADFGSIGFTAVHDSHAVEGGSGDIGGWAYKVSATLDLSDFIPGGVLHGMYMADGDYRTNYVITYGAIADPESVWQVAFQADLSDEVQLVAQYSHAEGDNRGEGDAQSASVGLNWFPAAAPGFSLRASYTRVEGDNVNAFGRLGTDYEADSFFVGVRRDF
ncbi:MAG: porin [Pseudomonadota bacterium]